MRLIRLTYLLLLLGILLQSPGYAKELTYAAVSVQDREATIAAHRDMVDTLADAIKRPIRISYDVDHAQIIDDFIAGNIDIAYLGPLPYVAMARRYDNHEILVTINEAPGCPWYRCTIVRAFDGPEILNNLSGPVALTNPLSTCGYLSVAYLLKQEDIQLEQLPYSFVGSHDQVALEVIRGRYAIGGVKEMIAKKYHGLLLEVMALTPPLPGFVLVANRATLTEGDTIVLRTALTHANSDTYKLWDIGSNGFSYISRSAFDLLKEMTTPTFNSLFMEQAP